MSTEAQVKHTILRRPMVLARTGLSCSSIYDMMAKGLFPKPVPIGKRAVGWVESTIDNWIADRINQASHKKV